jgi:alpha-tubulin suppressor-like RCC1 family protein
VKDTTPPAVVARTPIGTDDVPVDYTFSVGFSEMLDPSTVTSATATIPGVEGTVSSRCSSVFFRPTGDLSYDTTYTLTIANVADAAGNVLRTPYSFTFTTCALARSIAAGGGHALVLKRDQTVWAWGANGSGQLGDGTTLDRSAPVPVRGLGSVSAVAGGGSHSLALEADGSLWAWGANDSGQLGDGTTIPSASPVQVGGMGGAVVSAVSGGSAHSFALTVDGTVWAWGANGAGQLGDGTTAQRTAPVRVTGLTAAFITAISGGTDHSLALDDGGTVWAWGANDAGQLGDGTTTSRITPAPVTGLTNVTAIAATNRRSFALKDDGTVWVWGD